MSKIVKSKYKLSRRFKCALWGESKDPYNNKKNYAPGQHGPSNKNKPMSAYGKRKQAAALVRAYYRIPTEKQFKNDFTEAQNKRGNTIENFIGTLESRLGTAVYRLKFATSIFAARQLVGHGHIMVNGKRVNKPAFKLKEGDIISIAERSKSLAIIQEALENNQRTVPSYLTFNKEQLAGTWVKDPLISEVPYPFNLDTNSIIEYYSR